ncbi:MAG: UvrD-helicase domain-containing protein, partial [Pseudomonadota bacterium]
MNIADKDIRKRAADPTVSAVVSAPAGAGKTSVLLLRLLNCLAVSERPEHVAAITFTNKAVNEIRERVIGALHLAGSTPRPERDYEADIWDAAQAVLKVDRERDWNLAANPSRLRISTFDSFCRALIQRLPVLAGSTLGQVSEHASLLYREAVLELLADIEGDDIDEQTRDALEVVLGFSNNRTEDVIPILSSLLRKRDQWAASVLTLDMATMEQALSDAVLSEYGRVLGILRGHDFEQVAQAYITASSESETLSWAAEGVLPLDDSPQSIHFVQKVAGSLLKTDGDLRKSVTKREGFEAKKAGTAEANAWVKPFDGQPPPALLDALRRAARLPSPVIDGDTQLLLENLVVLMRRLLPTLKLIFDRTGQCDFVEMALAAVQSLGDGVEQYGDALLQEDRIQHLMVD